VPVGLGEPLFDKLDADIAYAMMGLNAVKGVEIGAALPAWPSAAPARRCAHAEGFASNNAGGVLGGISTGQDMEVSIAIKPTSSILSPRESIDIHGQSTEVVTKGRHDPCVGIRAAPIAEALLALVLMDHALRHRASAATWCRRCRHSRRAPLTTAGRRGQRGRRNASRRSGLKPVTSVASSTSAPPHSMPGPRASSRRGCPRPRRTAGS
jgi:chorismate synthase